MATFVKLPVEYDDGVVDVGHRYVNLDQVTTIEPTSDDRFSEFHMADGRVLRVEEKFRTLPHQLPGFAKK